MKERRTRRSDSPYEALTLFLDSVRRKTKVKAISLTDDTGLLVTGAGDADIESIGAVGAASQTARLESEEGELHTRDVTLPWARLRLTTLGAALRGRDVEAGIQRILE